MKTKNKPEKNAKQKRRDRKKTGAEIGATRNAPESSFKWGRYVFALAFFAMSSYALMNVNWSSVYSKAYDSANRPLANISIEGEFKFVSKGELKSLISAKLDGSFVDLDLQSIKFAIEENAWVDSVTIERIWPDSLLLKIIEHKPIARWNDDGFINHEGELVKTGSNDVLASLPLLSGSEVNSKELAKNYVVFSEALHKNNLKLSGLGVDEKMSWTVDVGGEFTLVLGRFDIRERLENFQYVYKAYLETKKQKIKRVDMRYERGLAVEWTEESKFVAVRTLR